MARISRYARIARTIALVGLHVGCGGEPATRPEAITGAAVPPTAPAPAAPATVVVAGAVDVCVGGDHSCALDAAGAVYCWGDNLRQQVGPQDFAQTSTPTRVPGVPEARRLVCGPTSTCVVTRASEVWCWGDAAGSREGAARVPFAAGVREYVRAPPGGCAVSEDGKVRCHVAGFGGFREVEVPGVADATAFVPAEPGASRVCVERRAGPPICFRPASHMPVKRKGGDPPSAVPVEPVTFSDIAEVAAPELPRPVAPAGMVPLRFIRAAAQHACGVDEAGAVHCWGRATAGQLGDRAEYVHAPARVPGLDDAVSLAVGEGGACAARRSGELVCWGRLADADPPQGPRVVEAPARVDEVALGSSLLDAARVCAREVETRTWRCRFGWPWLTIPAKFVGRPKPALVDARGRAFNLNLRGAPTRDFFFSQVSVPIAAISADGYCAVDTKGALVCGHCGACDRPRDALTTIAGGERFVAVGSLIHDEDSDTAVCALTASGATQCFAIAEAPFGRAEPAPLAVSGLPGDGAELSSWGGRYAPNLTCVRTRAGEVHCFGDHRHGQHAGSAREARRIEGLPAAAELGVGGSFACTREATGAVWCWGSNRDGAAPNGAPLERPDGVRVELPAAP